jgi:hypothetical protein
MNLLTWSDIASFPTFPRAPMVGTKLGIVEAMFCNLKNVDGSGRFFREMISIQAAQN